MTSHANPAGLSYTVRSLCRQTRRPDQLIVLASGLPAARLAMRSGDVASVIKVDCEDRSDWGHEKRAQGLALATGDWLGFFNDDDSYDETYLKTMLAATDGVDLVLCGWFDGSGNPALPTRTTSGNFVIRRQLAQAVGYVHRIYQADNRFLEEAQAAGARVREVPDLLYQHNRQPWSRRLARSSP